MERVISEAQRRDLLVMLEGMLHDLERLERSYWHVRRQVESLRLVLETPTVAEIVAKERGHDDEGIERA